MLNITTIRKDFPSLSAKEIYFDNACQSLRPKQVIEAMNEYYFNYPACGERSLHNWGNIVTSKIEEARKTVADFLGTRSPFEIIFTKNTTEAINLVAHSLFSEKSAMEEFDFKKRNVVITADKEHNSNFLPWRLLEEKKMIKHIICPAGPGGEFDLQKLENLLKKNNVGLVSLGYSSNIDGITIPAEIIIKKARQYGALVMLDAAQSVSHRQINVKELDVDFLAFSGHKILGPAATGVLFGKFDLLKKMSPFMVGGGTVVEVMNNGQWIFEPPPRKFEAGLQNYPGIMGLSEAIKYVKNIGFDFINSQEANLSKKLNEGLLLIKDLNVINAGKTELPLATFYKHGTDSHQICLLLNNGFKIMARSGQFCNHYYFSAKNIPSAVRISLAFYNTEEEVDKFIEALEKVLNILK